jgi:hypothetical protein
MVEAHANGVDPWKPHKKAAKEFGRLFSEERETYGDLIGDIEKIMQGYFKWYEKDPLTPLKSKKTKKLAEHKFHMPLTKDIVAEGKIDMVARSRDRRVWLTDHKSVMRMPNDQGRYSDLQAVIYNRALPMLGFPESDGVCWNYIRAKPPTVPEQLKNGELSKRQNIDTTWEIYLGEIKRHKLDPHDYKDMKKLLEGKEGDFFERVYLPRNKDIEENMIDDAVVDAMQMKAAVEQNDKKFFTRSIEDQKCNMCSFKTLCQAELRGLDWEYVIKSDFKVEKKDDEENEEEE